LGRVIDATTKVAACRDPEVRGNAGVEGELPRRPDVGEIGADHEHRVTVTLERPISRDDVGDRSILV
jgi:hypothetical protein